MDLSGVLWTYLFLQSDQLPMSAAWGWQCGIFLGLGWAKEQMSRIRQECLVLVSGWTRQGGRSLCSAAWGLDRVSLFLSMPLRPVQRRGDAECMASECAPPSCATTSRKKITADQDEVEKEGEV